MRRLRYPREPQSPHPLARRAVATFAACALTGGCVATATRAGAAPATVKRPVGPARAAAHGAPAPNLLAPATPAAPWLAPPIKSAPWSLFGNTEAVAWGAGAALVRTDAGRFAATLDRGVLGPLALPAGAMWTGLGANNAVLAATPDGSLYRAGTIAAAARGSFSRVARVPGATTWGAAGRVVVAGAERDVFVSTDGGHHFRRRRIRHAAKVTRVFARADGAVVVRAASSTGRHTATYVARRGRNFIRTRFQPDALRQDGAWIWEDSRCPALLSADGRHWVKPPRHPATLFLTPERWTSMLWDSDDLLAVARSSRDGYVTATSPPAPPFSPARQIRRERHCGGVGGGLEGGLADLRSRTCADWRCIRGANRPAPRQTRRRLAILEDASCDSRHANNYGDCASGAPLLHPPHLAIADRVTHRVALLAAPDGCARPSRVRNLRGLSLLFCPGAGKTRVFALTPGNHFRAEEQLPVATAALTKARVAPDGTIAVYPVCHAHAHCRAFVRRPLVAGAAGAWREVAPPGATAFWVVGGGAILILSDDGPARGSRTHLVTFALDTPTGSRDLATRVRLRDNPERLVVQNRRILLEYKRVHRRGSTWFVAGPGNRLLRIPPRQKHRAVRK